MSTLSGTESRPWSRRLFLQSFVAVGAGLLHVGPWLRGTSSWGPGTGLANQRSFIEVDDMADLFALAEVLYGVEDAQERADLAQTVPWWVSGRSTQSPYAAIYQEGLRVVRGATEKTGAVTFSHLASAEQHSIVEALFSADPPGPFRGLAEELLEGIYSAAPGWRAVGYRSWPGVRSGFLEYTRAPAPRS
jgi:hypothetical protein